MEILENHDDCRKAIRNDVGMVLLFPNDILIFLNAVGEDTDHGGSEDTDHGGKMMMISGRRFAMTSGCNHGSSGETNTRLKLESLKRFNRFVRGVKEKCQLILKILLILSGKKKVI